MLKGIHPLLTADLLHALAGMGHGDEIVLADANFPATRLGRRVIELPGASAPAALDAVLTVFPLDDRRGARRRHDAGGRRPGGGAGGGGRVCRDPRAPRAGRPRRIGSLERHAFYERARGAAAVVRTGELRRYGNILLVKGVINRYESCGLAPRRSGRAPMVVVFGSINLDLVARVARFARARRNAGRGVLRDASRRQGRQPGARGGARGAGSRWSARWGATRSRRPALDLLRAGGVDLSAVARRCRAHRHRVDRGGGGRRQPHRDRRRRQCTRRRERRRRRSARTRNGGRPAAGDSRGRESRARGARPQPRARGSCSTRRRRARWIPRCSTSSASSSSTTPKCARLPWRRTCPPSPRRSAAAFARRHGGMAVVTLGAAGAVAAERRRRLHAARAARGGGRHHRRRRRVRRRAGRVARSRPTACGRRSHGVSPPGRSPARSTARNRRCRTPPRSRRSPQRWRPKRSSAMRRCVARVERSETRVVWQWPRCGHRHNHPGFAFGSTRATPAAGARIRTGTRRPPPPR